MLQLELCDGTLWVQNQLNCCRFLLLLVPGERQWCARCRLTAETFLGDRDRVPVLGTKQTVVDIVPYKTADLSPWTELDPVAAIACSNNNVTMEA